MWHLSWCHNSAFLAMYVLSPSWRGMSMWEGLPFRVSEYSSNLLESKMIRLLCLPVKILGPWDEMIFLTYYILCPQNKSHNASKTICSFPNFGKLRGGILGFFFPSCFPHFSSWCFFVPKHFTLGPIHWSLPSFFHLIFWFIFLLYNHITLYWGMTCQNISAFLDSWQETNSCVLWPPEAVLPHQPHIHEQCTE